MNKCKRHPPHPLFDMYIFVISCQKSITAYEKKSIIDTSQNQSDFHWLKHTQRIYILTVSGRKVGEKKKKKLERETQRDKQYTTQIHWGQREKTLTQT